MFDNIKLKICPPPKKISLSRRIENIRHTDENSYRGYIKNMQVYKNINCVTIYGSLPKEPLNNWLFMELAGTILDS